MDRAERLLCNRPVSCIALSLKILMEISRSAVLFRYTRVAALAVALAGASACGPDGPPPYYLYPGPCASDLQCAYGLYCVEPGPGGCYAACRSDFDCVPGYACSSKKRRGTKGDVTVCSPR